MLDKTNQKVVMLVGSMASGKTTYSKKYQELGFVRINRDDIGGKIVGLLPHVETALKQGKSVVLDNTFPTIEMRKPFVGLAHIHKVLIEAVVVAPPLEDCLFNACQRMVERYGRVLSPEECKKHKDPNVFGPGVIYNYRKIFQAPSKEEGFSSVSTEVPLRVFERPLPVEFCNKAIVVDYDGTLRLTKSGNHYPVEPSDISILPNTTETLRRYQEEGYLLLGVSNQSGVHKGVLTLDEAKKCFEATNELIGLDIKYTFCPHQSNPIACYCRKPGVALGVELIHKYKLNSRECIMVGDLTTDKTFAGRCGFQYQDQADFFNRKGTVVS